MKRKTKVISIVLSISALMMFVSCQKQKAEWKGKIEEVDGVTVVKNPKEPMYGEDAFSLEEELALGVREGQEEYMFSLISIDIDNDENIYVLDREAVEIRVFSKNGNHLFSFGEKGQGPGEIQRPFIDNFMITPKNEIFVHDLLTRRIIFFSLQGEYLRQISIAASFGLAAPNPIKMDVNGNLIASLIYPPPPPKPGAIGEYRQDLQKFDYNLSLLTSIKTISSPYKYGEAQPLRPSIVFDLIQDEKIILGISNQWYDFTVLNSEGKVIKRIYKDYTPVKITRKQRERYEANYLGRRIKYNVILPKNFPAFSAVYSDNEGKLLVQTYEKVKNRDGYYYFDVFDSLGKYTAKIPIKVKGTRQYIWKTNMLYTVEEDEDGYIFVKRYKITWKY